MRRLVAIQIKIRWAVVAFLWLTVGSISLWWLRGDIALWIDYFSWSAVRVAIRHERLAFLGLGICVALTLSASIRHSLDILGGISKREYQNLVRQVQEIEACGRKHILWRWVIKND